VELIKILDTTDFFLFEHSKVLLTEDNIPFQSKNTMDSSFNNFGSYEIYVPSTFETEARKLIYNVNG
jgi:hypothetical protein